MADPVDVHVLEVWRDGKGDQGKGQRRESVLAREERGRRGGEGSPSTVKWGSVPNSIWWNAKFGM